MFYDYEGNPITQQQWAVLFADERHIGEDKLEDGVRVSTVYLGLDHQFEEGPPMIFETMIFGGEHADECWRWSNEREAREGHRRVVAGLRELQRKP